MCSYVGFCCTCFCYSYCCCCCAIAVAVVNLNMVHGIHLSTGTISTFHYSHFHVIFIEFDWLVESVCMVSIVQSIRNTILHCLRWYETREKNRKSTKPKSFLLKIPRLYNFHFSLLFGLYPWQLSSETKSVLIFDFKLYWKPRSECER